uniref:L1 transposable element RRM domain-containing protein n=1 Tax=Labrus bergylta TaxID=56723 RepID=A0A3Q3F6N2_9LABR
MSKQTKIQPRKSTAATTASQTSTAHEGGKTLPTMDATALIHEVTQNFSDVLENKLFKFSETLEKISTTLESQSKRITAAEQRVSDVEDTVAGLEARLADAEKKMKVMADGIVDMENRSRRDNIRVLNLKEGTEGKRPIDFFESWLPTVLSLEASPGTKSRIKIDRAHRSLGPRGARPRPVIIRLHNSRDKPRIMAAVRATPNLEYEGQRIFIHQDLSSVVRERRRAFNNVCQALIHKGIRFNMRFPATLTVNYNGAEHKFETPRDADNFINTLE